jgi:hypothetical protein
LAIVSNRCDTTAAENCAALYSAGGASGGIQYAKITRYDVYTGAYVRSDITTHPSGYLGTAMSSTILRIYRMNNDLSLTQLGSDISFSTVNGDIIEIRASGSIINLWVNAVQKGSDQTDSTWGDAYLYGGMGGYNSNATMDDFDFGDYSAGGDLNISVAECIGLKSYFGGY